MNDYTVIKARFVEWLKLPPAKRNPPTMVEFAKAHGIDRRTLDRWKNDPEVKRAVADHGLSVLSADDVSEILFALKQRAKEGNVNAAKVLFEMAGLKGRMKPDEEPEYDTEAVSKLSDAELKEITGGDE